MFNKFLFKGPFCYVGFCSARYFESGCLQLTGYSDTYCTEDQGESQPAHYQNNQLLTGEVMGPISCKFSLGSRELFFFCCRIFCLRERKWTELSFFWKFATQCFSLLCRSLLNSYGLRSIRKVDKFLWTRLEGLTFALVGKRLQHF